MLAAMIDLVLDGPGKNALGTAMMQDLQRRLAAADGAPVLLRGAGDVFSAGLNLVEIAGFDADGMRRYLGVLEDLITALYTYRGPLVAYVHGHAIAGGCILALCCDHRVCAPDPAIKFGLNEVALGLRFPRSIFQLVRRRVAPQSLDEVVLGGRLYEPRDALRVGFVDELGDEALARERLAALARHPAEVYALTKADLRAGVLVSDPEERRAHVEAALPVWTAPALKQRLLGFLTRKAPRA